MSKKYGLGKGLGALIPEEDTTDIKATNTISINLIKSNDDQPRKLFDQEKIAQLAESIKEHGIIQPIVVRKDGENYAIVAGERRWRASKLLGLKEVPVVVMDLDDKQTLEVSLIENIQREDLNPIEEAIAYKKLIEDFRLTQEEMAARIGKSRTAVTNSMRLLNLDSRVQQYIIEGVISEGHGRALLGIENEDAQYTIAQKIIDETLSVREVEKLVKYLALEKEEKKKEKVEDPIAPYLNDIKYRLENHFGTKVSLSSKGKDKGRIEIEYYSEEDLNRIIEILNI